MEKNWAPLEKILGAPLKVDEQPVICILLIGLLNSSSFY